MAPGAIIWRREAGAWAAEVIGSWVWLIAWQLKAISFWECLIAFGEEVTVLGLRAIGFAAKAGALGARAAAAAPFTIVPRGGLGSVSVRVVGTIQKVGRGPFLLVHSDFALFGK